MSRISVDVDMVACQDHGQCVIAAPEVFWFNDEGRLEYKPLIEDADDDLAYRIEEAADICPLQAIMLTREG